MHTIRRTLLTLAVGVTAATAQFAVAAGQAAQAATPTPAWSVTSVAVPSHFAPGDASGNNGYTVTALNTGGAPTDGTPFTITDNLPPGLTYNPTGCGGFGPTLGGFQCGLRAINNVSDYEHFGIPIATCDPGPPITCTSTDVVAPGQSITMSVPVDVAATPPATFLNHVSVSGGGAPTVTGTDSAPASAAPSAFGFQRQDTSFINADGSAATQAGSHPYQAIVSFHLNTDLLLDRNGSISRINPAASPRNIITDLPAGLVVNPNATATRCTEAQLEAKAGGNCPASSVVGTGRFEIGQFGGNGPIFEPIYNMETPPGSPASLGFDVAGLGIFSHLLGKVRTGDDYGLSARSDDTLQFGALLGATAILWGNPSDPSHDALRGPCAQSVTDSCPVPPTTTPFLTLPSACSGPLTTTIFTDSWQHLGDFASLSSQTHDPDGSPVGVTGCSTLDFDPTLTAQPDTAAADSPTALDIDLKVPQTNSHDTLATANLKQTVVDLPVGMAVNPSAADGLGACTPAQIGLTTPLGSTPAHFTPDPDNCPDSAKVGSVQITTPLLDAPLQGQVFIAQQDNNPFANPSLLALYITIKDPTTGVVAKLPGKVTPDPDTGQLRATFDDTPQLPFSDFALHFKGGSRATLVTPPTCGTYTTTSKLVPWSAADPDHPTAAETVTSTDSFKVTTGPGGGPCPDYADPGRFAPEFSAGTVTPQAGGYSPFVLKISKLDGTQSLKKIAVTLPLGLTAKLAGIPRCAQSAIVPGVGGSTSCPAGSQVGTVTVGAGAGSSPFFLADQPVYLTDGYDGAPFGLAIDTHALAGPFDLGHVVVRTRLSIDPITTQVSADAEPLPSIIQGIPLHIRNVTLKMDHNSFVLNPTNCAAQTVAGQITGGGASFADPADDTVKSVSSPFQVGGCTDLGLSPKLAISLTGKGQTTDNKHPGVHATVSQSAGQANLKKVVVSLPLSLALDPDNANGLCEFTDGSKVEPTCPKASIVGKAVARTPILDQPLSGPVYFVKNIRKDPKSGREIRTLPKLVIPLTGENGLRLNLVGTSNVVDDRLVTTFDNIPDAPVSDFTLDINGGKGGILVVSGTDICKSTQVADQQINGQNGKTADADVYLQTPACPLKIISKKAGKTSVAIKISGLGAGKVTVSGKGIKKTTKTIAKSTVATITAKRTKGKPGKVTVSFDPTGPAKARKTTK